MTDHGDGTRAGIRDATALLAWWVSLAAGIATALIAAGLPAGWAAACATGAALVMVRMTVARVCLPGLSRVHERLSARRFLARHWEVLRDVHAMRMQQIDTMRLFHHPYVPTEESAREHHLTPVQLRELAIWADNQDMPFVRDAALDLAERIEINAG